LERKKTMENFNRKNLNILMLSLGLAEGRLTEAAKIARSHLPALIKGDVGATTQGDLAGSFSTAMAGLFLLSMEGGPGVYDTIRPFGKKAGLMKPMFIGSGPLIATVVGESVAIPVVKYAVDSAGLVPKKVAGMAVGSNEAMKTEEGAASLQEELRQALILATDLNFLADMAADAGATLDAGAYPDPLYCLKKLLDAVNLSGFGNLFWACSPQTANFLCTLTAGVGTASLIFPDMTPKGGILLGVQALVTGALTDSMQLLDAGGIVTGAEDLEIKLSQNAAVEMDTSPGMNSQTPAAPTGKIVSMFQTESSAVVGIRRFAAKLMRPSAVAVLTGLSNWGEGESS
jgi:hypothetical protein